MDHKTAASRNRLAWEYDAYQAWCNRYGTPRLAAEAIQSDPHQTARRVLPFLSDPTDMTVLNPLGSHGRIAVSLALLGASVTVLDISHDNARYARELAKAAGVGIEYIVGDFLETAHDIDGRFDAAVLELGIVHYFLEIESFAQALRKRVRNGGQLVLCDFHPIAKKSLRVQQGSVSLVGDYFDASPQEAPTPYGEFLDSHPPTCIIRRWTLGDIVTAIASSGFRIMQLQEHPMPEAEMLPGSFTLVAEAS